MQIQGTMVSAQDDGPPLIRTRTSMQGFASSPRTHSPSALDSNAPTYASTDTQKISTSVPSNSVPHHEENKYNEYNVSEQSEDKMSSDGGYGAEEEHVVPLLTDMEIVNDFTCCLSFLLHEKSPLWQSSTTQGTSFKARCAFWQSHYKKHAYTPPSDNAQHALWKLAPDDDRVHRWPQLMQFYTSWNQQNNDASDAESSHWTNQDIVAIKATLDAICARFSSVSLSSKYSTFMRILSRQKTFENPFQNHTAGAVPLSTKDNCVKSRTTQLTMLTGQMREFVAIETVHGMLNYLRKYKIPSMQYPDIVDEHDLNIRKLTNNTLGLFAYTVKQKMAACVRDIGKRMKESVQSLAGNTVDSFQNDEDFRLLLEIGMLPMTQWEWTHVVYWCEKTLPPNLKPFAVIFHEWRLDGNELMLTTEKHIECLIKCSYGYPNNYHLVKLLNSKDINRFITEIHKYLIQSAIICQYDLYWKVLGQIKLNKHHPLFTKVWNIIHLVRFLRPGYAQGPKALWKQDAIYFSKIDNILSILMVSPNFQRLFRRFHPRFIFDDNAKRSFKHIPKKQHVRISTHHSQLLQQDTLSIYIQNRTKHNGDCLDTIGDKCCGKDSKCPNRYCFEFVHEFDRIYCSVIITLCLCVSLCCVFIICFMSYEVEHHINTIVQWTSESIGDRTMKQMSNEFFVVQMVLSVAVSRLYSGDIPIHAAAHADGEYDRFFTQYKKYKAAETNVHSLYMYELQNRTLIGSWCDSEDNLFIHIFEPKTGCVTDYAYDLKMERRDTNNVAQRLCDSYDPTATPWYALASENDIGFMGWTEPYEISKGTLGMTMVHKVLYNDVEVVFFSDLLMENIKYLLSGRSLKDMTLYIITAEGNVIVSDDETEAEDPLVVETTTALQKGGYLVNIDSGNSSEPAAMHTDDYDVLLYPFHTVYDDMNEEHAVIVIRNHNTRLEDIESAIFMSIMLYAVSLSLILLAICFMGTQLRNLQKLIEYKSKEDLFDGKASRSIRFKCFCHHKTLWSFTFWYCVFLFVTMYWIWNRALENSLCEIVDAYLEEEYYAVHETAASFINIAETITDVVEERFSQNTEKSFELTSEEFSTETETFLTQLMDTFRWTVNDNPYYAHMIHIATTDGKFIGITKDANDTEDGLLLLKRDASTFWDRVSMRLNDKHIVSRNSYFDPRCRKWYKRTLEYMFEGDITSAFGGDDIIDFYMSKDSETATVTEECVKTRAHYLDIWNVDESYVILDILNTSGDMNNIYRNNVLNRTADICTGTNSSVALIYDIIWSQYVFISGDMGWTASKPIIDEATGDILAVIAVDLSPKDISAALNSSNNYNIRENEWISWIFRGDGDEQKGYDMVASSEGNVTKISAYAETLWRPLDARYHPNDIIRMDSKQIMNLYPERCGSDSLPINKQQRAHKVPLPQGSAFLFAGRLLSVFGDNGVEIDWIVAKSIDINNFLKEQQNDTAIIAFVIICTLFLIYCTQQSTQNTSSSSSSVSNENEDSIDDDNDREEVDDDDDDDEQGKLRDLHDGLENIVQGSSAEMWGVFLQQYFAHDSDNGLLTANIAKEFMANQSNKHISNNADNHLTFLSCALQLQQKWKESRFLSFIASSKYNGFIVFCLFMHCLCSFYLPPTPAALRENKLNDTNSLLTIIYILIIIEIMDVLLVRIIARYIEFVVVNRSHLAHIYRIQFGFHHKYVSQIETKSLLWLILFGTKDSNLFLIHLLFVSLVVIHALLMSINQIGIFQYYIPIVPLLTALRCDAIREFCIQFFHVLYSAKNIFVSYLFFITTVSLFAQSIFTASDTWRTWITSFVFVVTHDNYNEVVYDALADDDTLFILHLMFFVIIWVIGLFLFIPLIIHKFHTAFNESRNFEQNKDAKRKTNAYVAAFIMLDMKDNGRISMNEFQHSMDTKLIIAHNMLSSDDMLSLHDFVAMLSQNDSVLNEKRASYHHRYQSYLECNWFRKHNNRLYTLILLIIPSVAVSLVRGVSESKFTSSMITFFFICNFIDINLCFCAFGIKRYGNLNKYKNPAFVEEAITIWKHIHMQHRNEDNDDDDDGEYLLINIKLTHIERQWVSENLYPTEPLSSYQKNTISIIHRFELYIIWFGFIGFIASHIVPSCLQRYRYLFLQIYLLRLFSLIELNQRLIILIFTIAPHFVYLSAFVMLFVFIWAQIGCTLFASRADYVPQEMYTISGLHSFDDLASSILLLLQLMIGKGWHQIMYLHMIATHRALYAVYFIFYIVFTILIISNVFIGFCLSEINGIDNKHCDDHYQSNNYDFKKRKQTLANKAKRLQNALKETLKEIHQIENVLQKNKEDTRDKIEMKQMTKDTKQATVSSCNMNTRKITQL